MSSTLLKATDISVKRHETTVLAHASLYVNRGEIVTLIGPNGAGKTTLVRVLLGLVEPDEGSIERSAGLRIGYMPQKLHIDPNLPLSVKRFLLLACNDKQKAMKCLEEVGALHLADSPLHQISGGEIQRVLLARALVRNPELLVLDEPAQGVDISGQTALYELISHLRDQYHCGILMVSHDLHLVMSTTDTVICLNKHICCQGHPEHVSTDPAYLELFGAEHSKALAVYTHHHDHNHDIQGNVVVNNKGSEKSAGETH